MASLSRSSDEEVYMTPALRPIAWILISTLWLFPTPALSDAFGAYWYQGKAEITSYDLSQARYGEIHEGHAVLIFVTEDLSASRQVKLDEPSSAGAEAIKVLKLNTTRKFTTGIYPYSMMTSVFTPVYADRYPQTLKVTTSSQEWCGHTFTQLNLVDGAYRARLMSYFEREGDRDLIWSDGIPEDEIWNRIRLNPSTLPSGSVRIIPGTIYQRLKHRAWGVYEAEAAVEAHATDADLRVYTLVFDRIGRRLSITFRSAFPHEIESWEETSRSGFGPAETELTTRAKLRKRIVTDYWRQNKNEHAYLRGALGLEMSRARN